MQHKFSYHDGITDLANLFVPRQQGLEVSAKLPRELRHYAAELRAVALSGALGMATAGDMIFAAPRAQFATVMERGAELLLKRCAGEALDRNERRLVRESLNLLREIRKANEE